MVSKFYDVTDLETGKVMKSITTKEFQSMIGKTIVMSKYCVSRKPYMKRWKIEFSDTVPEESEPTRKVSMTFDAKLYDEWNRVCGMFKNVEWIGGKHEQKHGEQIKRLSVCCKQTEE